MDRQTVLKQQERSTEFEKSETERARGREEKDKAMAHRESQRHIDMKRHRQEATHLLKGTQTGRQAEADALRC